MNSDQVNFYCEASGKNFAQIADKWIQISPKTEHIIECYEVYRDLSSFFQILENFENSHNVYQYLKAQGELGVQSGTASLEMIKFVFQFIIQISHAFAIAHYNELTHGEFNLS